MDSSSLSLAARGAFCVDANRRKGVTLTFTPEKRGAPARRPRITSDQLTPKAGQQECTFKSDLRDDVKLGFDSGDHRQECSKVQQHVEEIQCKLRTQRKMLNEVQENLESTAVVGRPQEALTSLKAAAEAALQAKVSSKEDSQAPCLIREGSEAEPDAEPDVPAERSVPVEEEPLLDSDTSGSCKTREPSPEPPKELEEAYQQMRSLTAQLMDARQRAEELKAREMQRSADAAAEKQSRRQAEEKAAQFMNKCKMQEHAARKLQTEKGRLLKENANLHTKLQNMRGSSRTRPGMRGSSARPPNSARGAANDTHRLAAQMADTECAALRRCSSEEKAALKKRLLLKWHPDKQPSADHSHFATLVVQEMQNCTVWHA